MVGRDGTGTIAMIGPSLLAYRLSNGSPAGLSRAPSPPFSRTTERTNNPYDGYPLGVAWNTATIVAHTRGPNGMAVGGEMVIDNNSLLQINYLTVSAQNIGTTDIHLQHAYIISEINESRMPMVVSTPPQNGFPLEEVNPVPPKTELLFKVDFVGMAEADFLKKWNTFSIVIECDGKTIHHLYGRQWVIDQIDQSYLPVKPHVTKR